ncbi:MalY/PatB family protein [Massilistercora timonensis]|uniref:MalY/PatB family protein n=1 Tax=Massilistercora timonensis TaxID=2086584 RepID=UPI003AB12C21
MKEVCYKERRHTDSKKWDACREQFGEEELLPLWVADMDFEAPACVREALRKYVDFGVFGYYHPSEEYGEAFVRWEAARHGYQVEKEWLRFSPGVVPAVNWLVQILTKEEDHVLIMPPVYYPFKDSLINNHRQVTESPLIRRENSYVIDYEDFERKIEEEDVKLFILCSPHNPVGRVWKKEEIRRVMDICKKHGVYVISDEIHQDLVMKGHSHIPTATAGDYDEILVTLTAATKTFNLAACQNSIVILPDPGLRERYDAYTDRIRIKGGNSFGYVAVQSAYEDGADWLAEVLEIIEDNYNCLKQMLEEALPKVWIAQMEGTYLMWIDLGAYLRPEEMEQVIQGKCGLAVDYGSWFGKGENETFIRVNLATKQENVRLAGERIIEALRERA